MTEPSMSPDPESSELPPPPRGRNPWKIVAIVLGSVVAVIVILAIIGSQMGDNRDEKLAERLPESIEKNFQDKGIDVEVASVDCEDLPTSDGTFSITCDVRIVGIDESVEATVQGSVDDDFVQIDEVFSKKRLLTSPMAVTYVQGLVDQLTSNSGIAVLECDLGSDVAVIEEGSVFTCTLDSQESVEVTVAGDGSGRITNVTSIG